MPLEFTREQLAVIDHELGRHGRVLACPGTGKSSTAVGLAERLLSQVPATRLRFLTFTRAATQELARRLPGEGRAKPATIHSFAIGTLLRNPGAASFPQPLRIPDSFEWKELIRPHLAQRAHVGLLRLDDLVREMAARWESLNPEELPTVTPAERARFLGAYTEHRRVFGYTLLDELPDLLRTAVRDHDDLVGLDYDLLIVDEYQDLNACELELLQRLAARGTSVLAIGDDDQSIYSFRKAHPIGIRRFVDDFPGASDYLLTICQRFGRRIAEWAQFVIGGDPDRNRRPIECRGDSPPGVAHLLSFAGEVMEARGIADLIVWLDTNQDIRLPEILLLSRTGAIMRPVIAELERRGIPVFDPDSIATILGQPDNRGLIATLRLVCNSADSLAWHSLLFLETGIGRTFINHIYGAARSEGQTFGQAFLAAAAKGFTDCPAALRPRASAVYARVLAAIGGIGQLPDDGAMKWGKWIIEVSEDGRLPPCDQRLEDLLTRIDEIYPEIEAGLDRYLAQINPLGVDLARAQSEGVRVMSMVGSKGLTVRATIVVGVDDDLVPRPNQQLAEERRLLYVAMTRSREFLFLTWARRRRGPAARSGRTNTGRRTFTELLRGGPVESEEGERFVATLPR